MSNIIVNRVARATILAVGTVVSGMAFASTPVNTDATYSAVSQTIAPRGDVAALQTRANQMDDLINNGESAILTSDPSLGTQWMNRIVVSGQINVDGRISQDNYAGSSLISQNFADNTFNPNYGSTFNKGYSSGLALNDSELDVDAQINCWVKAHLAFTGEDNNSLVDNSDAAQAFNEYGRVEANTLMPDEQKLSTSDRWIDEAYITLGDMTQTPFFATVGREYVPFGHYQRHELTPDVTTALEETQGTAANLGFVTPVANGASVYGSVYALNGLKSYNTNYDSTGVASYYADPARIENGGADLGVVKKDQQFGYGLGVSYLQNMADVNTVSNVITGYGMGTGNAIGGYSHQVPAVSAYGTFNVGPFAVDLNGVTATRHFASNDLAWTNDGGMTNTGAMPWAASAQAGYNFSTAGHDSQVYFNYGHTDEAVALALPENRYLVGYNVGLAKNTTMEFQVMYNDNYSSNHLPTGANLNTGDWEGAARLSVAL